MKIFFLPMDAHGHVNSCVGLALMLKDFNHEIVFGVPKRWSQPIEKYDFKIEVLDDPSVPEDQDLQEKWGTFMGNHSKSFALSPREQFSNLIEPATRAFIEYVKIINDQLPIVLDKLKPDLIILDFYVTVPAVVKCGRPWMLLFSCNPLRAYEGPNTPPSSFGLSVDTDPTTSMELKMFMMNTMKNVKSEYDEYLISKGVEPDPFTLMIPSPYLNLYSFPSDLDYTEFGPIPDKWFRLDHMVRKVQDGPLGFDESFFDRPGKKVLLSLGSMGGADVELMKRLVSILSKSKHQFIVSKGLYHDRYELADNMVGGKYINQMAVLPRVDLVMHHGGNNTFVETIYFGKPCIILPLFGDQHDNGRRIEDLKLGRSFRPHTVTEEDLLPAIDELIENQTLKEKLSAIREKVRNSKSIIEFNKKIEEIVSSNQMSGASYTEDHIIDLDDPYDLSLTLEDTEDDFNIEDITEDQVKELLADEENRFLLDDDEPLESTSSQINIIDRRVNNDKSSVKIKSNDSKSFRNTGNLITIDCDDEDDEEESELDDRRHSKFKSERVIRNADKKTDEKDIPETLEAVVLDSKESTSNGPNNRGNTTNHHHNQRGKGRNFMAPSARPFIGNNSLSSMGLIPTPLQSFNRIHVNPNFKPLATQSSRLGNPMELNNFRHIRPRGGGIPQTRLLGVPRHMGPRPVHSYEDLPNYPVITTDPIEALIASQSLDYEMEDHASSSHRFLPNNHNNPRPPLFNEPFVDNWSHNQSGIPNHQPWMKHPTRPSMGNFHRIPGIFNPESNLRGPMLGSFQRGMQMNSSLFGNAPRHPPMRNRLPNLTFFNQPNFPMVPRVRQPRLDSVPHSLQPNIHRHQIPVPLGYSVNAPTGVNQGQKRPQPIARSSVQLDNKRQNNLNQTASTSSNQQSSGHHVKNNLPFKAQESSSSPQSINKVTSTLSQRIPRPSTSNVNLKNIRPIKTVNSASSSTSSTTLSLEARKAALLKAKAARRLLQKENMNRVAASSSKEVEVIDLISSIRSGEEGTNEQNKEQPIIVDLDIDDEYKKKLEEQKRLREEIIRKKEERRRQMVAEKMKQTSTTSSINLSPLPTSTTTTAANSNSTLTTGQQLRRTTLATTIIERSSPSKDVSLNSDKRFNHPALKRKAEDTITSNVDKSSPQSISSSLDIKKVEIKGLAQTTTKATITKLCTSVGPIEDCVIDVTNAEKKAVVTFKSPQHARQFQSRYQRHLVDLCVIQVSLLW